MSLTFPPMKLCTYPPFKIKSKMTKNFVLSYTRQKYFHGSLDLSYEAHNVLLLTDYKSILRLLPQTQNLLQLPTSKNQQRVKKVLKSNFVKSSQILWPSKCDNSCCQLFISSLMSHFILRYLIQILKMRYLLDSFFTVY